MAAFGRTAALATLLMAAGTAAFIPAFKLTSVANVALIYASAPLLAAGLSWLLLWERSTWTVMVASVGAFAGVLVIVSGSFGASALAGDLLALFMTLMMAGTMIVYRAFPKTTAALPAAVSSVVLLPIACALGRPLDVPTGELPWLILFGVVFAIASVTLAEGARRLPSAETALLSILEVPLAPVLAWAILAETPEARVIGGGGLIVICVIWSQQSGQAARDRQIRRKDT
jgi:drug/metabolite transporter (DMT)-like permease